MAVPHVAVVGAGIVGAAVAHALTTAGVEVTVVEADTPGAGTSGTSLAWLNSNRKQPRSYHDFSVRAMGQWQRLAAAFGRPAWYVPTGNLTWACDDDRRAELAARVARLREWRYPVEQLDAVGLRRLEPHLRVPADAQGAHFPTEGFVHARDAVHALLDHARAGGAHLVTGRGPARLQARGSRVDAVRLGDGGQVRADAYVCCAGWRTPALLEPLGVRVPLVSGDAPGSTAPALVARVATARALLGRVIHAPGLSLRPTSDGLCMDAEDVNARVDVATAQPDLERHARELVDRARASIPGLPPDAPVQARLCVRPLPVDGKPVVGWLPPLDNAYLVVGHSGVTLAPLLARLTVAEVAFGRREPDLDRYRMTRFASDVTHPPAT